MDINDDLRDYVHTMPITSIGKVVSDIELFDMSQGIDFLTFVKGQ